MMMNRWIKKRKTLRENGRLNLLWFGCGALAGLTALSVSYGSVPTGNPGQDLQPARITDDTALYQKLSELQVRREGNPSFDGDIERLSRLEGKYRERLPSLAHRVRVPMERISRTKYRFQAAPARPSLADVQARPKRVAEAQALAPAPAPAKAPVPETAPIQITRPVHRQ